MDLYFDLAITVILSALRSAVKNPERQRKMRNVFLKVAKKIDEVYGSDPDFKAIGAERSRPE